MRSGSPGRSSTPKAASAAGADVRSSAIVISTHVLDTERGEPAEGVIVELYRGESLLAAAQTDADGRIAELSPDALGDGDVPARLPPSVGVLPPSRARDRSRRSRAPLPRAAARLALLVRELPRQLTVDELAELFEGRTPLVERLADDRDPLGHADEVAPDADRGRRSSRRSPRIRRSGSARDCRRDRAAEQGSDDDPAVLAELAELNRALRGALRLPLRRLRQPAGRRPRSFRSSASGWSAPATRSWTRR